jgi:hypothetical protein
MEGRMWKVFYKININLLIIFILFQNKKRIKIGYLLPEFLSSIEFQK